MIVLETRKLFLHMLRLELSEIPFISEVIILLVFLLLFTR